LGREWRRRRGRGVLRADTPLAPCGWGPHQPIVVVVVVVVPLLPRGPSLAQEAVEVLEGGGEVPRGVRRHGRPGPESHGKGCRGNGGPVV